MTAADSLAPRLLFRTAFAVPVWRIWPAPGVLAVELRDAVARTVSFAILRTADGQELFRYHDPAAPWWLALAGCTSAELVLAELDPDRLGQPARYRAVATGHPLPAPAAGELAWQIPVTYRPESSYFGPLAQLVEKLTGFSPTEGLDLLETPSDTIVGFAGPGAAYELLSVAPGGVVNLRAQLTGAPGGFDDARFCTFGPILYALGAPGEILAWELPPAVSSSLVR